MGTMTLVAEALNIAIYAIRYDPATWRLWWHTGRRYGWHTTATYPTLAAARREAQRIAALHPRRAA